MSNVFSVCCDPCREHQLCCEECSCCVQCHFAFEEAHAFPHLPEQLRNELAAEHRALEAAGYPREKMTAHAQRETEMFRRFCPAAVLVQVEDDHRSYERGALALQPQSSSGRQSVSVGERMPMQRAIPDDSTPLPTFVSRQPDPVRHGETTWCTKLIDPFSGKAYWSCPKLAAVTEEVFPQEKGPRMQTQQMNPMRGAGGLYGPPWAASTTPPPWCPQQSAANPASVLVIPGARDVPVQIVDKRDTSTGTEVKVRPLGDVDSQLRSAIEKAWISVKPSGTEAYVRAVPRALEENPKRRHHRRRPRRRRWWGYGYPVYYPTSFSYYYPYAYGWPYYYGGYGYPQARSRDTLQCVRWDATGKCIEWERERNPRTSGCTIDPFTGRKFCPDEPYFVPKTIDPFESQRPAARARAAQPSQPQMAATPSRAQPYNPPPREITRIEGPGWGTLHNPTMRAGSPTLGGACSGHQDCGPLEVCKDGKCVWFEGEEEITSRTPWQPSTPHRPVARARTARPSQPQMATPSRAQPYNPPPREITRIEGPGWGTLHQQNPGVFWGGYPSVYGGWPYRSYWAAYRYPYGYGYGYGYPGYGRQLAPSGQGVQQGCPGQIMCADGRCVDSITQCDAMTSGASAQNGYAAYRTRR